MKHLTFAISKSSKQFIPELWLGIVIALIIVFCLFSAIIDDDLLPVLISISVIVFVGLIFLGVNVPKIMMPLMLFGIFGGPIAKIDISGKAPTLLILDVIIFLILIVCCILWLQKFEGSIKVEPLFYSFLLFIGWTFIISINAIEPLRSFILWRNYSVGLLAMVVAMEYAKTKSDVYRFVVLLMIWSVVLSSLEYFSLFSHAGFSLNVMKSFVFQDKNIIATTWGKSNYLAAFWVVLIPFAMSIFGGLRSTWRWGVLVVIGLMFTALLITFSRGGLLGTLVGIMLVISRYLKPKMIFTFLAIITILFLAILINPTIFSLIEELLKLDKSASVMSRVDFWKDTWRIFLNHPFWGVGLGNLGYYSTYASNAKLSAHNIILGLMAEAGIAGCVFFSILIMRVLKKLVNSYKIVLDEFGRNMLWGITSAMVGAIVHSMFEPTFEGIEFSIFIWTIVGVAFKVPLIF